MFKDFFFYTKRERRVLLFFAALSFIGCVIWAWGAFNNNREDDGYSLDDKDRIEEFLASLKNKEKNKKKHEYNRVEKVKPVLENFDPNTADSLQFIKLGLPYYVASNILKYREAGGKFSSPESFSKVYGMKENIFNTLEPYIIIADRFLKRNNMNSDTIKRDTAFIFKYPEGTLVELNTADTTELKKIPGIGIGIARMIVGYRDKVGGFYKVEQLSEIEYIKNELMRWFKVESPILQKVNANKASLDKLRNHPYINFYQAKVIIEYRRKRGKIKNLSQLSLYEEFTEKDLERLSHYLYFD